MARRRAQRKPRRRPTKGALIRGASQKVPRELLLEPTFREELRGLMRGYSGLYVLYKRKSPYYIGLARNLFSRLHSHTKDKHKKRWDRFVFYRIARVRYLKDIESLLLRIANPPGNAVGGKFHRDAEVTKALLRIQRQQTRTLARIKKALQ
jgi:hypothetical protein